MEDPQPGKHGIVDFYASKYIYKYQPISENALENLKNEVLWASPPEVYNDPFEFRHTTHGENRAESEIDQFFDNLNDFKVICLAEDPKSILMWSHYADHHKGMCLGFYNDTISYAINYSNEFPEVDFSDKDERTRIEELMRIWFTKSPEWQYERERRMIFIPGTDPKVTYPGELFMIAFGLKTSQEDIDKVKELTEGQGIYYYKCDFVTG